jgi:hypothetical protein
MRCFRHLRQIFQNLPFREIDVLQIVEEQIIERSIRHGILRCGLALGNVTIPSKFLAHTIIFGCTGNCPQQSAAPLEVLLEP